MVDNIGPILPPNIDEAKNAWAGFEHRLPNIFTHFDTIYGAPRNMQHAVLTCKDGALRSNSKRCAARFPDDRRRASEHNDGALGGKSSNSEEAQYVMSNLELCDSVSKLRVTKVREHSHLNLS